MKNLFLCFSLLVFYYVSSQVPAPQAEPFNGKNIIKNYNSNFLVGGIFGNTNLSPFFGSRVSMLNTDLTFNNSFTSGFASAGLFSIFEYINDIDFTPLDLTGPRVPRLVYLAGNFTYYNNGSTFITKKDIIRVTENGSIDNTFANVNLAPNIVGLGEARITAIEVQPDGKILIAGQFKTVNGKNYGRIARLNQDGTIDTSFGLQGNGFDNTIFALALQPDGKIVVGGDFTFYHTYQRNRIARLNSNGTLDLNFCPNAEGVSSTVRSVLYQNSDGKILFGGDFITWVSNVNPAGSLRIPRNKVVRVMSDGSLDGTFNGDFAYQLGTSGSNDATINTISDYGNGKIFLGGSFSTFNNSNRKDICLLNSDGSLVSTFNPTIGTNGPVMSSIVESSGNVVVVGNFSQYNSLLKNGIVRIAPTGLALRMLNAPEDTKSEDSNRQRSLINQNSAITIFPNPASNQMTIKSQDSLLDKILIYSIDGRLVFSQQVGNQNSYELDLTSFSKGVFLVSVQTKDGKSTSQKVVIK